MISLDPKFKTEYKEGDKVEFAIDGNIKQLYTGSIRGIAMRHLLDHWIIELDEKLANWPYSCIVIQHTFIRHAGSNTRFLCENQAQD